MKKLLAILFVLSLTFTCWSCGDDDKPEIEKPKPFVWNGDWNDPADPNYKPEGYNPIQGLWKSDKDNRQGVYFSEDFKDYKVTFYSNGYEKTIYKSHYQINDKAFRYSKYTTDTWRYKIEDNKLLIYPTYEDDKVLFIYTKVEE